MNIEEIMKPYFDKKEEISKRPIEFENGQVEIINKYEDENKKLKEENALYQGEISALKARLENLRNNKAREIEEYVQNSLSDRPEFYAGYGAMIRKDLEQSYLKREKELEKEIEAKEAELKQKINNIYLEITVNNKLIEEEQAKKYPFYNVDVRELVDVKHDLRKKLISTKKDLENKLKEVQLDFDTVMLKLSTFKYEYDENHNVLNGKNYRALFEESNRLVEVKYNLQKELNKIEENLKITELTEEEIKILMMSMTELEKKEYESRKNSDSIISTVEQQQEEKIDSIISAVEELTSKEFAERGENTDELDSEEKVELKTEELNLPEPIEGTTVYETARKAIEEQQKLEESYSEFIKEVSKDILLSVDKLRAVKIEDGKYLTVSTPEKETENYVLEENSEEEKVQLVNGLYLNKKDVFKALNNYVRKNKDQSFTVKGIEQTLTVTRKSLKTVKEFLKECTVKKLFSEKKLSAFDIKRVFGKEKAEEYIKDDSSNKKVKMPTGDYILRTDIHEAFKALFVEKTSTWFETLKSKYMKYVTDTAEHKDQKEESAVDAEYEVVKTK